MALDVTALFLIAGLVISLCGGLLLLTRDRGGGMDPLAWWAVAMLLGGAGVLLMAGERTLPGLLSSDLSRALLLLAAGTSWTAARVFSGGRPRPVVAVAGAVLWIAVYQVPDFAGSGAAQTLSASLVAALYVLATAWELWRGRAERLPSRMPAIVVLGIRVVALIVRGGMAVHTPEAGVQAGLTVFLLLESMLHTIGMALLLLAMTNERAQRLVLASAAAERRTNEARSRFLAHMSHELRTPLNGLLGFAQVLARDPKLSDAQLAQIDLLEQAGRHLLSLANDALDLMRIDAGRLELDVQPLELAAMLATCVAILRPRAQDKGIELGLEVAETLPRQVLGDRMRLQQVVLNLLSNAVKFTPAEGRVRLVATPAEFGIRLEVIDTGPGVPEEKRGLLFQGFARLGTLPADPSEGAGLGLAICAGIVQAMEGAIGYRSGPRGIGSCFHVALPLRPLPQERALASYAALPIPSARTLRVLAVDDVRSNRLLLQAILEAEGHSVALAESGAACLALVAEGGFDAVLMDVRMPDLDGLAATRRIRGLPGAAGRTPIIGVSADSARHDVAECLEAGMSAHIGKPFERVSLLAALRQVTEAESGGG